MKFNWLARQRTRVRRLSSGKAWALLLPLCLLVALSLPGFSVNPGAYGDTRVALTVLHWNVYYGKGTDEVYDPERQVAWMASLNPDVISLNEVLPGEAHLYQSLLTRHTGAAWYSHHVPAQADQTGNQLLSTYPFVSTDSYAMENNGVYSRAVAQATIEVNGVTLHLFSTHLDHNNGSVRAAQGLELRQYINRFAAPVIVAGDLNATPGASDLAKLMKGLRDAWHVAVTDGSAVAYADNPPAINTRTHRERIDYILYSKKPKLLAVAGAQIPDTRDLGNSGVMKSLGTADDRGVRPSDHNLVIATFQIKSPSVQ